MLSYDETDVTVNVQYEGITKSESCCSPENVCDCFPCELHNNVALLKEDKIKKTVPWLRKFVMIPLFVSV